MCEESLPTTELTSRPTEDDALPQGDLSAELLIQIRRVNEDVAADPRRFAPVAETLVGRARRARDPEALVLALRAQAWAQRGLLAPQQAKLLLDEAVMVARRHGLEAARADLLAGRAAVLQELGRLTAAQRDLDVAARLLPEGPTAELLFQQAVLHQNIGRLDAAAALYRTLLGQADGGTGAVSRARPGGGAVTADGEGSGMSPGAATGVVTTRIRVLAANNLALIDAQHGRFDEALQRVAAAAGPAADAGPALAALVAGSRAWIAVHAGRLAEGLQLFEAATTAYTAAGLPLGEHVLEYADALTELRLIPEASAAARRAAAEFEGSGVPLMGAEAQLRVAQLSLLGGNATGATEASLAAAESFRAQGRSVWTARAHVVHVEARLGTGRPTVADLVRVRRAARALDASGATSSAVQACLVQGRVAAALGRTREAVDAFARATQLSSGAPVLIRLRGQVAAALGARMEGRDGDLLRHCRQGLRDLAGHRAGLGSVELRALASGHGAELGRLGLAALLRQGSPVRVLEWMERTRAAALMRVEPADHPQVKDDLDELRAIHAELAVLGDTTARGAAAAPLIARQRMLETRIRRATWHRQGGGRQLPRTTVPQLREQLGGRVLVEYGVLSGGLVAVVLEPRRSRIVRLGSLEDVLGQVRPLLFALRRLLQPGASQEVIGAARMSAELRLNRLRSLLLAPLAVPGDAELVIVPAGPLHGIGWAALHDGPVSLAPSGTFWAATREASAGPPGDGGVVLVAGPRLRAAERELRLLSGIHRGAQVLAGGQGTAPRVVEAMRDARLAHLACHGLLRADNPLFSALLLDDGPLTLRELEAHGVAPHRVVLAACESGADASYAGDEVLGFVSALLARGTAGVVASTTAIPDAESVDLMVALHRRLAAGDTLAEGLYEARSLLDRDDPGTFVNWCTFGAHGAG